MKNVILRYGLIGGGIVAILMLLTKPLMNNPANYDTAEILGYVSILLSLSTVFIAIKTFRDKHNGGKIKFGKAFLIGLLITLISGTIYALSFTIYFHFNPDLINFFKSHALQGIEKMNLPEAEKALKIAEMSEEIKMYTNPIVMFLIGLLMEYAPSGLVVSLIAALVLKKK